MSTNPLHTFLEQRVLKVRSGKSKLRLGVVAPQPEERQLIPLWQDLPETLFAPTLYVLDEFLSTAAGVLTDERQFELVRGLRDRDELLDRVLKDVEEEKLDLLLVLQGAVDTLARELMQRGGGSWLAEKMAGLALHMPESLNRPLLVGDLLIHAELNAERLAEIGRIGAAALKRVGVDKPKVAMLAAVETVNEGLPATVLGHEAAKLLESRDDLLAQGPLSLDLAISPHAAEKKGVTGPVVGHADMLAAPNMTVARGVYEALTALCEESAAAVLYGGKIPVAIPGSSEGREESSFPLFSHLCSRRRSVFGIL